MLATVVLAVTAASATLYGGLVCLFAVLLWVLQPRRAARAFRAVGPVFGISMGLWVGGQLLGRYLEEGDIQWALATPADRLDALTWLVFVALWFSSFVLEIWTLDPLRTLSDDARDEAAFAAAYRKVAVHLDVNAVLVLLWTALVAYGAS